MKARAGAIEVTLRAAALSLASAAMAVAAPGGATLQIDIRTTDTQAWQTLDAAERERLAGELERRFTQAGFATVHTRWCRVDGCAGAATDAQLALDVHLGEIGRGVLKRGISFQLGAGDPRSPEFGTITVMPIGCQLRTPAGRLLNSLASDRQISAEFASGADAVSGAFLAAQLSDTCLPVLAAQQLVVLAPQVESNRMATALPGIYVEKREIPAAEGEGDGPHDAGASASDAAASDTSEGTTASMTEKALRVDRQTIDKRVQYVLHNRGDTVTFEFGQHRR